ncbi:MAG TPA: 4Fe-4S binding protein [Candidatus Sumerlaeota bacterium]|nr:MAG: putative electron transport protein YccM [candidate division BRC1 bacterium ADurb.Bin183]HOE62424.1 4Fe-4S binding protein [Candidatus Sumerlaeota bacterium]HRR30775.1 4Fe-4S binding protein [Candidatus Sumerlaeia bacterium]HON50135.1 4Fe-4S binding protein [Candidatus Sumerlaeota bacterium]HOR63351.1 4Fe-4S binding protein [Candidatus Sumerlaeota bacterium]
MKRNWVQYLSLILLHSSWGPQINWICNPVLSCHSCALSWFACPIGVLVHFSGYRIFPFFAIGTLLLIGVLVGRLFCGWVCPFGLLQDLLYRIPGKKFSLPAWASSIKYLILVFMVFLIPFFLGELTMFSFCRICPSATLQVSLPDIISSGTVRFSGAMMARWGVLAAVIYFAIKSSRSFCKAICPIGALMAVLNYISFWKIKLKSETCVSCLKCDKSCPTDVRPSTRARNNIPVNRALDCIVCHDCMKGCPVNNRKDKTPQKAAT